MFVVVYLTRLCEYLSCLVFFINTFKLLKYNSMCLAKRACFVLYVHWMGVAQRELENKRCTFCFFSWSPYFVSKHTQLSTLNRILVVRGTWLLNRASYFNWILIWKKQQSVSTLGRKLAGLRDGMVDSSWPLPKGFFRGHWPCTVSSYAFFWPWYKMQLHCMFLYSCHDWHFTSLFNCRRLMQFFL